MKRYYFSRRGGCYYILDRTLGIHIAKCDFREAAALIAKALNNDTYRKVAEHPPGSPTPEDCP